MTTTAQIRLKQANVKPLPIQQGLRRQVAAADGALHRGRLAVQSASSSGGTRTNSRSRSMETIPALQVESSYLRRFFIFDELE